MNPVIGIIGGMGPLATCDLMNKIIRFTDAKTDQQHIRICVDCNTNIPDRTEAILHHGKNPVPELVKSALRLEEMGAQLLVMSCNTAHYFYDDVMPYVDVPFMNMIEETAKYLKEHNVDTAAVFATDGTRDSGVYERVLSRAGIRVVYPSEENQKLLMSLIYDYVKAGREITDKAQVQKLVDEARALGAQKMILGCTELPIAFEQVNLHQDTVDPTTILAQHAVQVWALKSKPHCCNKISQKGKAIRLSFFYPILPHAGAKESMRAYAGVREESSHPKNARPCPKNKTLTTGRA